MRRAMTKPTAVMSGVRIATAAAEALTQAASVAADTRAAATSSATSRAKVSTRSHEKKPTAIHRVRTMPGLRSARTW